MLAGYLPFDDDPANPEGDNINLLYKYIVNTPLTFPEYVTPHARDLLRRILVPEPRRRADLFEVARHSWLSEYSHVVGFIGSSTKSDRDIATSAMRQDEEGQLGRSASVREPTSRSPAAMSAGAAAQKQPPTTADSDNEVRSKTRDTKRRTVQLEYVPPKDATARGDLSPTAAPAPVAPSSAGRTRARGDAPVEVTPSSKREPAVLRKDPPASYGMPPPVRPARDQGRAASDSTAFNSQPTTTASRPGTQGSLGAARLPSRGNSYSQPVVPTPTNANAQGQLSQPKSSSGYIISGPMSSDQQAPDGSRPASQQNLAQFQQQQEQSQPARGHKRSSTLGSIGDKLLGRNTARRTSQQQEPPATLEKKDRKYPPVSMRNAMPNANDEAQPRQSTESSRRTSFGFSRKNSDHPSTTTKEEKRSSRRFSLLPSGFSMNNLMGKKDDSSQRQSYQYESRPESKGMAFGRGTSRTPSESTNNSTSQYYEQNRLGADPQRRAAPTSNPAQYAEKPLPSQPGRSAGASDTPPPMIQRKQYRDDGYGGNLLAQTPPPQQSLQQQEPERYYTPTEDPAQTALPASSPYNNAPYSQPRSTGQYSNNATSGYSNNAYGQTEALEPPRQQFRPNQRNFDEQYDRGNSGSSSATRRVMDFFRRRGKDRSEG